MTRRIPPLKSLEAFAAAARLGSFSKAADELALTQSAVSQQLVKLEESLGQKLFLRRGKGVSLTAAGELLYQTVGATLQQLRAGLDRIEPYRNPASVLLACPHDIAQGWLLPRLDALRQAFPGTEVWIITQQDVTEIDRIDVDLVISRRPLHAREVEVAPLFDDERIAVAAPMLARQIRNLAWPGLLRRAPVLLLENEPDWNGRLRDGAEASLTVQRAATFDDPRLLLHAAEAGLGIAYLAHTLASAALEQRRIEHLSRVPPQTLTRVWLMRSRLAPRTPLADAVFGWLLSQAS